MYSSFYTIDGFNVQVYIYNSVDFSAHIFVANKENREVNSTDKVYRLRGRDAIDCLVKDGTAMAKSEILKMFFGISK